ncbi:cupin domain-containing protein [Chitinophaga silvisoli]|uniref:Cupin domain-containing protein n=1 Tax=Chitinophaga silvisoli TaxID=2291814 RepID=A0A3E1P337_9BACT|nr:cupin domain-containing protein [Chitinophaga silvisoli]RFM34524.1 cupin domain-containing protein [Chitinophaga silvisoli]
MADLSVFYKLDADIAWQPTDPGVKRKVMAYGEQLMIVKVAFEKGAVGTLHSHPHLQMSYVEKGTFEVEIAGTRKILQTGDVFSVPSEAIHGVVCKEEGVLIDVFHPMREDFLLR